MNLYRYSLSGFNFECNIELPDLLNAEGNVDFQIIVTEAISGRIPPQATTLNYYANEQLKLVCIKKDKLGFVAIWNNTNLEYTPPKHFDEEKIKMNLLGTIYMIMATCVGYTALHAACIVVNNKAVLFCGKSGVGKSSLTAYFYSKGHAILSDDITTVKLSKSGTPIAYPSVPRIKLTPYALNLIGKKEENFTVIPSHSLKYKLVTKPNKIPEPYPIGAIVFPLFEQDTPRFEMISGLLPKKEISKHIFRKKIALNPTFIEGTNRIIFDLMGNANMYFFRRPKDEQGSLDSFTFIENKLITLLNTP